MTDPTPEDEGTTSPQPFSQWLFAQRGGATHAELTDGLAELATAVNETGKAGKLVLEISIGPASKNGGHQMLVSDRVVVKAPTPKRSESFSFFAFDDVIKAVEDDTSCTVLAGSPIGAS